MNSKGLIHKTILLISSPAKAWEEIDLDKDEQNVAVTFVYPMIGLCGLVVFIGTIINMGFSAQCYQTAMMACAGLFIALFGGFFIASSAVNYFGQRFLGREKAELPLCQTLVGYSMVVIFLLDIALGLLPDFFILKLLLQFYTIFIVWEGASRIMKVPEKKMLAYTLFVSAVVLLSPALISIIFKFLSNLLR